MVKTDHILFIAAGAFHVSKPSDLIPELQGRFPIRVELEPLGREDFVRILTEPKNALMKQYTALLSTEGVTLTFTPDAIGRIADFATLVNERTENIGARRLHTVMEKLLDDVSFDAPDLVDKDRDDRRGLRRPHARRHRRATKICRAISCRDVANPRFPHPAGPRIAHRASPFAKATAGKRASSGSAHGVSRCSCAAARRVRRCAAGPGPEAPGPVAARRLGDTVSADEVPAGSVTGTGAFSVDHLEVYAVTLAPGMIAPANRDLLKPAQIIGTIPVAPPPDPEAAEPGDAGARPVPATW